MGRNAGWIDRGMEKERAIVGRVTPMGIAFRYNYPLFRGQLCRRGEPFYSFHPKKPRWLCWAVSTVGCTTFVLSFPPSLVCTFHVRSRAASSAPITGARTPPGTSGPGLLDRPLVTARLSKASRSGSISVSMGNLNETGSHARLQTVQVAERLNVKGC